MSATSLQRIAFIVLLVLIITVSLGFVAGGV